MYVENFPERQKLKVLAAEAGKTMKQYLSDLVNGEWEKTRKPPARRSA